MNAIHALFRKRPRSFPLFLAVHFTILAAAASEQEVLYEVDFSGPAHRLNEPPATGTAINLVSKVVFGSPEVVTGFGPLKDRPLLFRGREGYDQIKFDIKPGWSKYRIEYDLVTSKLQNSRYGFTAFVDTPQVRAFSLHGALNRATRFPGTPSEVSPQLWADGKKSRYVIEVDIGLNKWEIWQDGIQISTAPLDATNIRSVRFSLSPVYGGTPEDLSIAAALDNLKITATDDYLPGPPKSLTVEGKNRLDGLLAYWPAVPLADSYRLYRSQTENFETAKLLVETSETRHVDSTARFDEKYVYWVTTVRRAFESAESVPGSGLWEQVPPTILSISKGERADGIALFWMRGTASTSYQIHRSFSNHFSESSELAQTASLSHLDTTAEPGRKYYYWITSKGANVPVNESAGGYGVRGFQPMEDLVVTFDPRTGSFRLQWGEVAGASHYTIYRSSTDSFANADAVGRISGLSFTDDTIASGSDYRYWVIPGTVETRDLAIAPGHAVTSPARPDLWVRNATDAPVGKGVTNQTGAGQSITMTSKNKQSFSGTIGITTLDAGSELVSLSGSAGNRSFRVNYFRNGNVTAAMNAGTFKTSASPGAPSVNVVVTPSGRDRGRSKTRSLMLQIRGASVLARDASDLVILRATGNSKR